jgi:hypothetical protein
MHENDNFFLKSANFKNINLLAKSLKSNNTLHILNLCLNKIENNPQKEKSLGEGLELKEFINKLNGCFLR